jgi:hypothetical protein
MSLSGFSPEQPSLSSDVILLFIFLKNKTTVGHAFWNSTGNNFVRVFIFHLFLFIMPFVTLISFPFSRLEN